jgi:hypothetical protein
LRSKKSLVQRLVASKRGFKHRHQKSCGDLAKLATDSYNTRLNTERAKADEFARELAHLRRQQDEFEASLNAAREQHNQKTELLNAELARARTKQI